MWLLADLGEQLPDQLDFELTGGDLWALMLCQLFFSLLTLPYFAFWLWMLVHCYRTEPDRQFWLWILIIAQPIGTIAYFFLRYIPSKEFPTPAFLRRWTRHREITRKEIAAQQIGNAHQFVQWGDALREVGMLDQARQAYDSALAKDAVNLPALWGAAQVAASQKRYDDVRQFTQRVIEKDPQYKFGDVSLAYGRALNELGDFPAARTHLEQHVRRWRHPEGVYMLAKLCADQGDTAAARQHLQAMLQDIQASPLAIARKFGRWKSRGRQLLRKLPK